MENILVQLAWLFILAIPIACVTWTITHEELFKEFIRYCESCKEKTKNKLVKKFFYLFTCEYCLSHYLTILMLLMTHYKLLFDDWRGYVISLFSLVWIANIYMSFYSSVKTDIKLDKTEVKINEKKIKKEDKK